MCLITCGILVYELSHSVFNVRMILNNKEDNTSPKAVIFRKNLAPSGVIRANDILYSR